MSAPTGSTPPRGDAREERDPQGRGVEEALERFIGSAFRWLDSDGFDTPKEVRNLAAAINELRYTDHERTPAEIIAALAARSAPAATPPSECQNGGQHDVPPQTLDYRRTCGACGQEYIAALYRLAPPSDRSLASPGERLGRQAPQCDACKPLGRVCHHELPWDRASRVDPVVDEARVRATPYSTRLVKELRTQLDEAHEVITALRDALASRDDVGATPAGGTPAERSFGVWRCQAIPDECAPGQCVLGDPSPCRLSAGGTPASQGEDDELAVAGGLAELRFAAKLTWDQRLTVVRAIRAALVRDLLRHALQRRRECREGPDAR